MKSGFTRLLRWIFGLLLLWAAFSKLANLQDFYASLLAYQLPLPDMLLRCSAVVLPWLELFCGLLLLSGLWLRATLTWTLILFGIFLLATGQAWGRGLEISCGCFNMKLFGLGGSALAKTFESVGFAFGRSVFLVVGALYLYSQYRLESVQSSESTEEVSSPATTSK
ncbi:MAG: DoxX family protein [Pedosphaera sp.]|nr:DoxX family protein [Pedosphaera sp.]